jgi:hypothetical protein
MTDKPPRPASSVPGGSASTNWGVLKRWLSLWAYGAFTSTLFSCADTAEDAAGALRALWVREPRRNAAEVPEVLFEDIRVGSQMVESVRAGHEDFRIETVAQSHGTVSVRGGAPTLLTGDSAGGGLAVSLLVRLKQLGAAMPAGAILLSPWTDLTASGASVDTNSRKDAWFTRGHCCNGPAITQAMRTWRRRSCHLFFPSSPGCPRFSSW